MKQGTVRQRHQVRCPKDDRGGWAAHKCRGTWEYVLDAGRDSKGRRRQFTKAGYPTRADARRGLQQRLSELQRGVGLDQDDRLTMAQHLDEWLVNKRKLRPSTQKRYADLIELHIKPEIGQVRLRDLSARHVDAMLNALATRPRTKPLSAASLHRAHAVLRAALNGAVARRLIAYNPALHIELPAEHREPARVWTPDQVGRFLELVREDRLYALWHLVPMTGMRRGELVGLRWQDVDLDAAQARVAQQVVEVGRTWTVGPPKSRTGRRVLPLDRLTTDVLRAHLTLQTAERELWGEAWEDSGYVFTREDGAMLRPSFVSRRFGVLARRAGLPVIKLHELRHTSASLALAAGVALKVVSERLGHSTTAITANLYTHVFPAVAQDAADAIARVVTAAQRPSAEIVSEK